MFVSPWGIAHTLRYPAARGDSCNALQGIWDWSDLPTVGPVGHFGRTKGWTLFFGWWVDECVVVQNESHQNLTESIFHDSNRIENWWFLIGSKTKKHIHFWGIPNPIGNPGFNQSCRLKRWIFWKAWWPPIQQHPTFIQNLDFNLSLCSFPMRFSNFCPDSNLQTWDFEAPTWWGNGVRENNTNPSYPTTLPRVIAAHAIPTNPVRIANGAIPDTIGRMCLTQIAHWN